jgi:hypothetical protein
MVDAAEEWALYAGHRARFTAALLGCASEGAPRGRLCVLGAGKCNDLDLELLAARFSEIHLVDFEPAALAAAVSRQKPEVRLLLRPHTVDLSLISPKRAGKWQRRVPTAADVQSAAAMRLREILARLPGPFDVVASACMLTQLSFALRGALGEASRALVPARAATMLLHLNTLVGLAAPGGKALFACDLTSSTSYPLDALPASADLRPVLREIVDAGAGYFAANPDLIERMLGEDPGLEARVEAPELLDPWLWTGPLGRLYFVYALRLSCR